MPRDSSGNMTLAKAPFVAGTTIVSADVNADLEDIRAEIQDSLSRSGKGGLLAALRFSDGTVAAPAVAFTNETGTGVYRPGTNVWGVSVAGTQRLRATTAGAVVTGTLEATGAVTCDTTLGVTGKTTLTGDLEVQGASIAITTGDVTLTQGSSDQTILKSSGSLNIGTTDTNSLRLVTQNLARFTVISGGNMQSDGTSTLTNLPTPSATSDAATKGYVDGITEGLSSSTWASGGSWGTNWSNDGSLVSRVVKQANGVVVVQVLASLSSGTTPTAFTLPTGYRPSKGSCGIVFNLSTGAAAGLTVGTSGAVVFASGSASVATFWFFATFSTV